jgi:iron complex outermembrane receptor protein
MESIRWRSLWRDNLVRRFLTFPTGYRYYFNNGDKKDFNTYLKATYQFNTALNGYVDMQFRRIDYVANGIEHKQNMLNVNKDYLFFNPKLESTTSLVQINSFIFLTALLTASRSGTTSRTRNPEVCRSMNRYTTLRRDIDVRADILSINVNYYWMDYRNQLVLTGQVNDVGASVRTNVDKSYRMGLEMEGLLRISPEAFT